MTIFQINNKLANIFAELEDNGGELTDELQEELSLSTEELKEKVRSYAEFIKSVENDVTLIDSEIKRLQNLKKSKQKTIDNLKFIMTDAIERYGDVTKSGTRYIDYGTGKVSVRETTKVDVYDDFVKETTRNAFGLLQALSYDRSLEVKNSIDVDSFVERLNEENNFGITKDDLNLITTKISLDVPLGKVMSGRYYEFVRDLLKYSDTVAYKVDGTINKTENKELIAEGGNYHLAVIVPNKVVSVK